MSDESTKRKPTSKAGGPEFADSSARAGVIWFNPQPNSNDLTTLEAESYSFGESILGLIESLEDDERVSVKRDPRSTRWLAILFVPTGNGSVGTNALSVRGATPFDAVILLAYFHQVRFPEYSWAASGETAGRFG